MSLGSRIKRSFNAFMNKDPTQSPWDTAYSTYRPDRTKLFYGNERTIISSVYSRIANDAAAVKILHVRTDQNGRYVDEIDSGFNEVMTLDANTDQTGRSLFIDLVLSLFDEGCVAVVPTEASENIRTSPTFDIYSMRVGKILAWSPQAVKVQLYNEITGKKEEITLPKRSVAIIENPFYTVMNEPNSIAKRLTHKLNLLDAVDDQSCSGKLDLIIQLPYVIKSEARRQDAERRRKEIEMQLEGSRYGIAYTDGTERITQLNRPIENNLMKQIEYLTSMLYSQLGITEEILKGTADEQTMLNYYNRTVEPILSAITDEFKRKFLSKTARTQGQDVMFFRDPFKLVPVNNIADIADKFTRNEILSSNEVRGIIGYKPVNDPKADELRNKNLNETEGAAPPASTNEMADEYGEYDDTQELVEEQPNLGMLTPVGQLHYQEE